MSEYVRAAFEHRPQARLPRGELWIGTTVFEERQMEDDIDAHLGLCLEMGMDLVSVPIGEPRASHYEYRLFSPVDIEKAARSDLFVVAVLSGPLQRVVEKRGLRQALEDVGRDTDEVKEVLREEAQEIGCLIDMCTERGAGAVVLADDLAYNRATFISPTVFLQLLHPLYRDLVDKVHHREAYAVLHSDGNIASIAPDIISSGFDGLSCQQECLDLLSIKQTYSTQLTLLAGLSCELLNANSLTSKRKQQFVEWIKVLSQGGGMILSSSSGLHSSRMLPNARRLYHLADEALDNVDNTKPWLDTIPYENTGGKGGGVVQV